VYPPAAGIPTTAGPKFVQVKVWSVPALATGHWANKFERLSSIKVINSNNFLIHTN